MLDALLDFTVGILLFYLTDPTIWGRTMLSVIITLLALWGALFASGFGLAEPLTDDDGEV